MKTQLHLSPLKRWLRKNNLKIGEFAQILGCHRQTIRSVSDGKAVEETIARQIYFITNGEISPLIKRRGRPNCEHSHIDQIS